LDVRRIAIVITLKDFVVRTAVQKIINPRQRVAHVDVISSGLERRVVCHGTQSKVGKNFSGVCTVHRNHSKLVGMCYLGAALQGFIFVRSLYQLWGLTIIKPDGKRTIKVNFVVTSLATLTVASFGNIPL
jgi:hypothetical protein